MTSNELFLPSRSSDEAWMAAYRLVARITFSILLSYAVGESLVVPLKPISEEKRERWLAGEVYFYFFKAINEYQVNSLETMHTRHIHEDIEFTS